MKYVSILIFPQLPLLTNWRPISSEWLQPVSILTSGCMKHKGYLCVTSADNITFGYPVICQDPFITKREALICIHKVFVPECSSKFKDDVLMAIFLHDLDIPSSFIFFFSELCRECNEVMFCAMTTLCAVFCLFSTIISPATSATGDYVLPFGLARIAVSKPMISGLYAVVYAKDKHIFATSTGSMELVNQTFKVTKIFMCKWEK